MKDVLWQSRTSRDSVRWLMVRSEILLELTSWGDRWVEYPIGKQGFTPRKINMEPKNEGLVQMIFLFQLGDF